MVEVLVNYLKQNFECYTLSNKILNVDVYPHFTDQIRFRVSCAVQDTITCKLPQSRIDLSRYPLPQNVLYADPYYSEPGKIDLLLAADVYCDILNEGLIKLGKGLPTLQNTDLGYIISGSIPSTCVSSKNSSLCVSTHNSVQDNRVALFTKNISTEISLDTMLQRFWELEELPENKMSSPDEAQAEAIFKETTQILPDGRFQVNLPLISPDAHSRLGNSYYLAKKRFLSLENKLKNHENLYAQYRDFIHEYLSLNHAKYVPLSLYNEHSENRYFLPHHCVVREHSLTTKLRVVFDASLKTSSGISLNDILLKGYTTQPELFDILVRFRLFKYAFTSDIQKMLRQIRVNPEQTFLLNILWRDSPEQDLKIIELQTVTYGTNSASFLSTRCLMELALSFKDSYPLASDALLNFCYVDDILYCCDDLDTLFAAQTQLTELLSKAGISLHKWCSNSEQFSNDLSNLAHDPNYVISQDSSDNKVLGLYWDSKLDNFSISTPDLPQKSLYTKREVLSIIAQIYDPIGLINPVTVRAKIVMQKIWVSKIGWDDVLTPDIMHEWLQFLGDLPSLKCLAIPRPYFANLEVVKVEIHAFSDASLKAYASCVYLRVIYNNQSVSCTLISSKSKVAPIKRVLTIPKLELMGAVLSAKLTQRVVAVFQNRITIDSINSWTDSEIVLAWLNSHASRWNTFVKNRVAQIHELSANHKFKYIRSKDNPADILSRGMLSSDLLNSSLWFHGPKFLSSHDLDFNAKIDIENIPEEKKVSHLARPNSEPFFEELSQRFSTFSRFQRVMAWIHRFVHNVKSKLVNKNTPDINSGPLSVSELRHAELKIIKLLQEISFSQEINDLKSDKMLSNKTLISLSPFLDENDMLRVGGRLKHANINYDQKFPILLPSKNHLVQKMLRREHIRLFHSGPQTTLSNLRLRYWPLNGLREVKKIINSCLTCFRFKAQAASQIMSDLPRSRLSMTHPFTNVGVDFGGPFLIKSSNLRKAPSMKCYVAIFVSMTTRAVHIELVTSLSSDAFLLTLKRFIGRRGLPKTIFSDNATNFVGTISQLKELFKNLQSKETCNAIKGFLAASEIEWKFIPPRSPHHGGIWEAAIKTAKFHMVRLLGSSKFTFEELATILIQIECIMNSRPLCAMSSEPSDLTPLTPGHFLIGRSPMSLPEKDVSTVSENRLSLWEKCTQIRQLFWKRWRVDYLNRLQNKPKWIYPMKNIEVNDLVLLKDDNVPPLNWPMARVIEVFPGSDGKVRVLRLKTKDGDFTRSISKVCPLPEYN